MVKVLLGDLFSSMAHTLVNTVNTVGIMGKGVALQFKKAFPENYKAYKKACDAKRLHIGNMFIYDLGGLQKPRYIVNFLTKRHWRGNSRLEDIAAGLEAL